MLSPARHAFGLEVDSVGPTWRCQKESPHVGVLPRRRLEIARLGNKLLLCSAPLFSFPDPSSCPERRRRNQPARRRRPARPRDGVLPRRRLRPPAEPRAPHVPPRRRGRGEPHHEPRARVAARGVAGAPDRQERHPLRPPLQRRLRPLPRRHEPAGPVRPKRPARGPGLLRRTGEPRRVGPRQGRPPYRRGRPGPNGPHAARPRQPPPPLQRQVLQAGALRRLRRQLFQPEQYDALGGRDHPPATGGANLPTSKKSPSFPTSGELAIHSL
jgi:hypothetical protein